MVKGATAVTHAHWKNTPCMRTYLVAAIKQLATHVQCTLHANHEQADRRMGVGWCTHFMTHIRSGVQFRILAPGCWMTLFRYGKRGVRSSLASIVILSNIFGDSITIQVLQWKNSE